MSFGLLFCFVTSFAMMNIIATTDYTKLEFNDCGSTGVVIHEIGITPMPIYSPGIVRGKLRATVQRSICKHFQYKKI